MSSKNARLQSSRQPSKQSSNASLSQWLSGAGPEELRRQLVESGDAEMRRRRGIVALSLIGLGSMSIVSLLQTGIVGHLPDPPVGNFDSDRVNLSTTAYETGIPDGTLSVASLALNLPLAAVGGADRSRRRPWISLLAAAKFGVEALAAARFFYKMPAEEKAWCPYCIVGAVANVGIAVLALPEARRALRRLSQR